MTEKSAEPSSLQIEDDPRPLVALPKESKKTLVLVGGLAAIAIMFVFAISPAAQRDPIDMGKKEAAAVIVGPPPLALPPPYGFEVAPPEPRPISNRSYDEPQQFRAPTQPRAPVETRSEPVLPPSPPSFAPLPPPVPVASSDPALVIDGGFPLATPDSANFAPGTAQPVTPADSTVAVSRPRRIANKTLVVPVGTLIFAVLETHIDTQRPGMVRAVVSKDTRGFDGRRVLIPRGSKLIGEYQADIASGQNRVLVTWNTMIRPDGLLINLKSPSVDRLGGTGVSGRVHSFFLQKFGTALLQTALTIGTNLAASSAKNGSVIIAAPAGQVGSTLGQGLAPTDGYRPKITVKQGTVVRVFVARELDFSVIRPTPTASDP